MVPEIQPLHRVAGHEDALPIQHPSTPGLSSETSLQLKPDKEERLLPLQTPSRTEGSGQTSLDRIPDNIGSSKGSFSQRGAVDPHNDLDKAIEEAQATKDLVSITKYD